MIELSEHDQDLLELIVLKVPWYMVCGDFHRRYGSAGALARRLFELQEAGLLNITPRGPHAPTVTPELLEADAASNNCYDDFDRSWEPIWDVMITERGFELIEDRLKEQ